MKKQSTKVLIIKELFTFFVLLFFSTWSQANGLQSCGIYLDPIHQTYKDIEITALHTNFPTRPSSSLNPNHKNFETRLRREILLQATKLKKPIQTVLYPAIGSDAITAFKLFANATTVIGIDSNEFINSDNLNFKILDQTKDRSHYDIYYNVLTHQASHLAPPVKKKKLSETFLSQNESDEVDLHSYSNRLNLVEIVVTDILGYFPESEILSVELLKIPSSTDKHKISLSGRIRFREKPFGPIKTYLHIQTPSISDRTFDKIDINFDFLKEKLPELGYQAILAKGTMTFFETSIGEFLLDHVMDTGGLFVDGDEISIPPAFQHKLKQHKHNFQFVPLSRDLKYKFGYDLLGVRLMTFVD